MAKVPPKKRNADDSKVRIAGKRDSTQNELRGQLYANAFGRIKSGLASGNHFEVIFLVDSIITDRLLAITQTLMHTENEHYEQASIGSAADGVKVQVIEKGLVLPVDLNKQMNALHLWIPKRNRAAHGFVYVSPQTVGISLEQREQELADAAEEGAELARLIADSSKKFIDQIKKQQEK